MNRRPQTTINRTALLPSGRLLLRIDEAEAVRLGLAELIGTYRRGGAPAARIAEIEELAARVGDLFGPEEWARLDAPQPAGPTNP